MNNILLSRFRGALLTGMIVVGMIVVGIFFIGSPALAAWYPLSSGTDNTLTAVKFRSADNGIAVGYSGSIRYTADGGKTWTGANQTTPNNLRDVFIMPGTTRTFAVGDNGTVLYSSSSWAFWTELMTNTGANLNGIYCVSPLTCWTVGDSGTILKSTNGGSSWSVQASNTIYQLRSVFFRDANTGWAASNNGAILKTTNGGTTWTNIPTPITDPIYDIQFVDSSIGYAVAADRKILKTTNGGAIWSRVDGVLPASFNDLTGVFMNSATEGTVVGSSGDIFHTADGGTSWTQLSSGTNNLLTNVYFFDANLGWAVGSNGTIISFDGSKPAVPSGIAINPINNPTNNNKPTFSWSASTDSGSGVAGYEVRVDSINYTNIGNVTQYSPSALTDGTHIFQVRALDGAGNTSDNGQYVIVIDTNPPTVSAVSPTSATAGSAVTISASYNDSISMGQCKLYVNGGFVSEMTESGGVSGTASAPYTFPNANTYSVYVTCADTVGNVGQGPTVSVTAESSGASYGPPAPAPAPAPSTPAPSPTPSGIGPGSLIKLNCPSGADLNHPCRAVYYWGNDGKRHAFTNSKVYFSWYANFDSVQIVTPEAMAGLTLGRNVTYRPGTRLIKFPTDKNVYAIAKKGVLRWLTDEDVAKSLFGSSWGQQVDDVSDAFYFDYSFGTNVAATGDYNAATETAATIKIDDNF
ncbi:MAG: hypothetical protein HW383_552 [Candidatus Magasanikbacteria bacterium]|nr:hypothetical protein [Candidatus Magasanikbacteria bacterium]